MPTLKESLAASKELAEGPTLGNMHPDARAQAIARANALHGGKSDGEQPGASLAIPDGWKLVPVEPTFEMLDAYSSATMTNLIDVLGDDPEAVDPAAPYRAMLSASPSPAQAVGAQASESVGGWLPIESAPKDGTRFWACQAGAVEAGELFWDDPTGWCAPAEDFEEPNWEPTHWMPFPTHPPTGDAAPATNAAATVDAVGATASNGQDQTDAARYRWLRDHAVPQCRNGPGLYWYLPRFLSGKPTEKLDAAIDAAIAAAPPAAPQGEPK